MTDMLSLGQRRPSTGRSGPPPWFACTVRGWQSYHSMTTAICRLRSHRTSYQSEYQAYHNCNCLPTKSKTCNLYGSMGCNCSKTSCNWKDVAIRLITSQLMLYYIRAVSSPKAGGGAKTIFPTYPVKLCRKKWKMFRHICPN